ncbi:D-alanine-D-alanine ligase [Kaistia hirudinis]|uniref:D-alanine--D-alanine ligase n=1 Tax=Kaistia hirudinis TaxID=1293440 RepID=A0A840AUL9_9HYPH|nr:D-alanine--D-alanine ligase [Kaistia hirudinis]MBB3932913.1 D-alanine-D-alanine ligase [Kaistia hirudinis]MBN9019526.1 D-alanine--D-alanine ligase [Hyphomicrobiales bacterium]
MAKHVAVLMGGWSSERPVSLNSGKGCADALEAAGYRVTRVDVQRDVAEVLAQLRPDVAFNALHGPYGEDGCIQGILEVLGIPYTHSGVLASALAMNKARAKDVMKAAGIPVAESLLMHRLDVAKAHPMEPPYVVKPVAEGSSFGVLIVREGATHPPQQLFADDWRYGETVMVERYVGGRELTCGVKGDEAFDIIELVTDDGGWYDYDAKYSDNGAKHVIPAPLLPDVYQNVRNLAVRAHRALGCRGISRADFRYDDRPGGTGQLVCLEVNTQPGMTATSLVPDMARHAGIDFPALVSWMVEDASCGR